MRKSIALALVLVFAIAGASFAATPKFSGEIAIEAKSTNSFTGPFTIGSTTKINITFGEEGDNWKLSLGLKELIANGFDVDNYRADITAGDFSIIAAKNANMGKVATPFDFVAAANKVSYDRIRVSTNVAGIDTKVEFGNGKEIKFFGSTEVEGFTVGAGIDYNQDDSTKNAYVGYAQATIGIADIEFAAGSKAGATIWAIGAEADVTEQLGVNGEYYHDGTWNVGATFTEGIIRATVGYDSDSVAEAGFTYRGSEQNQPFADLFKSDKYYLNVAPAFGISYKTNGNEITLNATAPLADNLHALASITAKGSTTTINLDARFAVNEKTTISPYYKSNNNQYGVNVSYAVGSGATIGLKIDSTNSTPSTTATFTIKF